MKIVIMADSLAMPRQESDGNTRYESTYPYLLEQSLRRQVPDCVFIERGMRRRTIEYVLDDWLELVTLRSPEVVVIHVGVVDCAPRVFLRRERQFVEKIRPAAFRRFILNFVHKRRRAITKMRPRVYVPAERFNRLVEEVTRRAREARVRALIFVNIIAPPAALEIRSPGFTKNVESYNSILNSQTQISGTSLIDLDGIVRDHGGAEKMTVDGIHLNVEGHELLAHELHARIMNLITEEQTGSAGAEPAAAARSTS